MTVFFSLLALISGVLNIRADYADHKRHKYITKPLTMICIILLALTRDSSVSDTYKILIIVGLLFSMMGDIWLMLPKDYFIQGLGSFLVAHILYIVAFLRLDTASGYLLIRILMVIVAVGVFLFLRTSLDKYTIPVVVYMLAILAMGIFSFNRYGFEADTGGYLAVAGASMFMLSDATLAINRFKSPFGLAQAIILSTYFVAQWMIAMSI